MPHDSAAKWSVIVEGIAADGRTKRFAVDVKRHAVEVLLPAMQDPRNPQCCPLCFAEYAAILIRPNAAHCLAELMANVHDFSDACAKFLTVPRAIDDLKPLRHLLKQNAAQCPTQNWHPYHRLAVDDVLYLFEASLYNYLNIPFRGGPSGKLKLGATFARSRKGIWPTALDDLLPYGVEASIAAHVFWCHTLITPLSFHFISGLLTVARPTIWPAVLADPQRIMLTKAVLELLTIWCAKTTSPMVNQAGVKLQWFRKSALLAATLLLNTVRDGPDYRTGDDARFHAGNEQAVHETLALVFDSDISLHLDPHDRQILSFLALRIQGKLSLPDSSLHQQIVAFREHNLTPDRIRREYHSGSRLTHELLVSRFKLRTCAGPGCTIALAAATRPGEIGKLQMCGQCKFVLYCGRGCQQADWKDDLNRVPHKALCPVFCKLSAGGALDGTHDMSPQEYAEAYNSVGITKEDFDVLVLWGRTSGLQSEDMVQQHLVIYKPPEKQTTSVPM